MGTPSETHPSFAHHGMRPRWTIKQCVESVLLSACFILYLDFILIFKRQLQFVISNMRTMPHRKARTVLRYPISSAYSHFLVTKPVLTFDQLKLKKVWIISDYFWHTNNFCHLIVKHARYCVMHVSKDKLYYCMNYELMRVSYNNTLHIGLFVFTT